MTIARAHHGLMLAGANAPPPDPVEEDKVFPHIGVNWTLLNFTTDMQTFPHQSLGWTQLDYV